MKKMLLITASVALMGVVSTANAESAGEKTYKMACFACHGTGAAGSPKMGDKAVWKDRIAQGNTVLHDHAIKGYKGKTGYMPPKGGRADISDADVKAAVDYMVSNSK